jgi:hypothetical protein
LINTLNPKGPRTIGPSLSILHKSYLFFPTYILFSHL